ncbi:hypothetical protein [Geodermatophilus ruber]|uniref:Uncharacterized protein n=1 Tax=Geodermatophilus ruber TaxID=504800 RepID=A0A1I4CDU9_9ACTN|nr:hypothetical protein [Geodermatophilus ruber]SFK79378.1 hypothetical protein SAMN04488085_103462 [Geodermatophilus ruber]
MGVEVGIVARYFPEKQLGLIQTNSEDVIFFRLRDACHLVLDEQENRIVFTGHRELVPRQGELIVFERAAYHGDISGIRHRASHWGSYSTWIVFHFVQLVNLRRLLRDP